jgi:hypothetical protein
MGPAGPQGPDGPAATVAVNSVSLDKTPLSTSSYVVIPSSVTMTVPAGATVSALVNAEGDVFANISTGNQALVELHLVIDGVVVRTVRASSTNLNVNSMPGPWHLGIIKSLGPGSHEFHVEAEIMIPFSGTPTVTANAAPGNLSVALLRQ